MRETVFRVRWIRFAVRNGWIRRWKRDGKCVMTQHCSQMWALSLGVRYQSRLVSIPGTINIKPLHLCICCSAVCLPLKWVIVTPKLMYVCVCVCVWKCVHALEHLLYVFLTSMCMCVSAYCASVGWGILQWPVLFLCVQVSMPGHSHSECVKDRSLTLPSLKWLV